MVRRKKKHSVGSSWKATRKVGGKRRRVMVHKVGRSRYKIRVLGKKATKHRRRRLHSARGWAMDQKMRSNQPWERAYRKRKRRRRR